MPPVGEAAALVAAFTWSATSVGMARLAVFVTPVAISTHRLVVATVLLPILLVISGQGDDLANASTQAIIAMIGSGLLAYAIGDTIYIAALRRMGIQQTFTITMALFILLTVAGGILLLDEEFTWRQLVGAAFVAVGIYMIVARRGESSEATAATARPHMTASAMAFGYGLIVLVGVFWAAATLWLADGRGEMGTIAASMLRTPAGAAGMLAFGLATARADLASPLRDRNLVFGIVAVAVLGTLFGSLLYVYAVGEAGPGKASILNACAPLLALPLSVFVLKERLTPLVAAGTVVCVAGIILVVA